MATKKSVENSGDKFIEEVKASLDEAEKLMREAAEATGDKAGELREKALRSLRLTRDSLHDAQEAVVDHSLRAAKATDNYVHDKPWQAIGVAGIVGLMFGMLILITSYAKAASGLSKFQSWQLIVRYGGQALEAGPQRLQLEGGQRHAGVRAVEHARAIGAGRRI